MSSLEPFCPDCGAEIGRPHGEGCAIACCLYDGGRRLNCECRQRTDLDLDHACGQDDWTGQWPGEAEAEEFGWWVFWDGPGPEQGWDHCGQGWVRVTAGTPGAIPDLDRLRTDAEWDRKALRWVKR
ncbi:hypothetical protein [Actinomadura rupiterrae]|uniref:hypothetical protein n=1 Tax=Actinomadura rupiterrae TaxID=559627 RepID=UPI0020A611DB|nr:hypothetical protein [Actinomadura rupiterrae]MCP2335161.1 hypothetical protein [Actinomadura rupiterrae]